MPDSLPEKIVIEVKFSRASVYTLGERDLEGIKPDGHVAVLIENRLLKGPRWVLVPFSQLSDGSSEEQELCDAGQDVLPEITKVLNAFWSNFILDAKMGKLLLGQSVSIQEASKWCLKNHVPRQSAFAGAVRESRLKAALDKFRKGVDEKCEDNGPQQEGFVHQYVLAQGLKELDYQVTVNPIGVPDIKALRGNNNIEVETLEQTVAILRTLGCLDHDLVKKSLVEMDDESRKALAEVIDVARTQMDLP